MYAIYILPYYIQQLKINFTPFIILIYLVGSDLKGELFDKYNFYKQLLLLKNLKYRLLSNLNHHA